MLTEDSLARLLTNGRRAARARMRSRVTARVRAADDQWVTHPVTGLEVPAWDVLATGVRFRSDGPTDGASRGVTIGTVTYDQATGVGHLPYDVAWLAADVWLDVTVGEHVGQVLRVLAAPRYDDKTARRFPVAEEQRPAEWPTPA